MNTTKTFEQLLAEYITAHKEWQAAYDRAEKAIGPNGNEAESIAAASAYQAMKAALDAALDADPNRRKA